MQDKVAVVLLGFGGPDSLESILPFMERLTGRKPAEDVVERVKKKYSAIGRRSPLLALTREQARELQKRLSVRGAFTVDVAMRYWKPYIMDVFSNLLSRGYERFVAFPMAPFRSEYSTASYRKEVDSFIENSEGVLISFVPDWHLHPLFIKSVSKTVIEALSSFSSNRPRIVFSVHSLPVSSDSQSYVDQVKESSQAVMDIVGNYDWSVAFQSKGGAPVEWLDPELNRELKRISKDYPGVLVVPVGFSCDHVETLYDLDIEAKEVSKSLGMEFHRASTVNTNPGFIKMMEDLVLKVLNTG